ncbi:MAG TPA: GNAT family N-acetyltransferase [Spirochaetota bacterium]|nr:GNAT family N-acetyltransferase [Spirochaetota bacterium]
MPADGREHLETLKRDHPEKFADTKKIFGRIHRGSSIFVGTACGEPQHLVNELIGYVSSSNHALFGAEVMQVWMLGVAPYDNVKFKNSFRHNSFFVSESNREAVNSGMADYTPLFLSEIPDLLRRRALSVDVALVQASLPDARGNMSLGVSVDIVKSAIECAGLVVVQVNAHMPRVFGDGFIKAEDVDFLVPFDEPLMEFHELPPDDIVQRIGKNVARIVQDGDTLQVGYGSMPNAVISNLAEKKNLGLHTELLTPGAVDLMRRGVINNRKKTIDRGKSVASFCMGTGDTYEFINENPDIEFRPIQYTNSFSVISAQRGMTAINSALQIDLTGQATAESLGRRFYSGIGGQADFMRAAVRATGGKSILAMRSTSNDGKESRIVPFLSEGASASLIRGDVHYVVTEYGIAYLHAKNIRDRALSLIAIAHPDFRPWLVEEAKKNGLVYRDQAFVPGREGEYPEGLEADKVTGKGLQVHLRPARITDEKIIKDFFYSLSDKSTYQRFLTAMPFMPRQTLQKFSALNYRREMVILTVTSMDGVERVDGMGQYLISETEHAADVAFAVRDECQNRGLGSLLLDYLAGIAIREGILVFTATILSDNRAMLHVIDKLGFETERKMEGPECSLRIKLGIR